jgi:hypothetical protein
VRKTDAAGCVEVVQIIKSMWPEDSADDAIPITVRYIVGLGNCLRWSLNIV